MTARRSLLAALALVAGAAGCIDENILDSMADRQPAYRRYRESPFYADGQGMQAPPAGTVPRERLTQNAPLTTGRLPDGPIQLNGEPLPHYVTTIPLPVTSRLLGLGRKRYDITCGTCHGPAGDGVSIVGTQMALRPPPSLITQKYIEKPSGYIFEVATKGFGLMASYAAELSVEERWAVVAYLRALQLSQSASVADVPPDKIGELNRPPAAAPANEHEKEEHP